MHGFLLWRNSNNHIKYFTCISLATLWTQFNFPVAIIIGTISCSPVIAFLLTIWYRAKILSLILWKINAQNHCSLGFSFIKLIWENFFMQCFNLSPILSYSLSSCLSSAVPTTPTCNLYTHSMIGVMSLCESSRNHVKILYEWQCPQSSLEWIMTPSSSWVAVHIIFFHLNICIHDSSIPYSVTRSFFTNFIMTN